MNNRTFFKEQQIKNRSIDLLNKQRIIVPLIRTCLKNGSESEWFKIRARYATKKLIRACCHSILDMFDSIDTTS